MELTFTIVCVCCLVSSTNGFLFFPPSTNKLQQYNVSKDQISVSGMSSGAAMASQMHVIYSDTFMGAGMIAGVPFACSGGIVAASIACMLTPASTNVAALVTTTQAGAAVNNIDSTTNMTDDKVWIFNGKVDLVVNPDNGPKIESFYQSFIPGTANIKTVFNINAQHSQPTVNYGGPCAQLNLPDYINKCNYSAAFQLLNFIYGGNLQEPTTNTNANGQLLEYDQGEFFHFSLPSQSSMDSIGYVYVPTGCSDKTKKCKLHMALHGCGMGRGTIGDKYVRHSGYNEVAELNDIIIIYPQIIKSTFPANLAGCWDWWGYTGIWFATNKGYQPIALKRMIDKITG